MVFNGKGISELTYIEALIGIIISWILVALWQRFTENLAFETLGLNPESTFHTFMIAIVATIIFLAFDFYINGVTEDLIVGNSETMFGSFESPSGIVPTEDFSIQQDVEREEEIYKILPKIQRGPSASARESLNLSKRRSNRTPIPLLQE